MPHQCTSCDRVFPDGSRDLLSGCSDCENNTFRYLPDDVVGQDGIGQGPPDQDRVPGDADGESSVPDAVGHVATTLKDFVSENAEDLDDVDFEDLETDAALLQGELSEDSAQSSARSAIVSREELPEDAARLVRTDPGAGGAIVDGDILVGGTSGVAGKKAETDGVEAAGAAAADVEADATPTGSQEAARATETAAAEGSAESWQQPDLDELRAKLNEQFEGIRVVEPGRYELNIMKLYEREETIIALKEDGRYVIDIPDSWLGDDESK